MVMKTQVVITVVMNTEVMKTVVISTEMFNTEVEEVTVKSGKECWNQEVVEIYSSFYCQEGVIAPIYSKIRGEKYQEESCRFCTTRGKVGLLHVHEDNLVLLIGTWYHFICVGIQTPSDWWACPICILASTCTTVCLLYISVISIVYLHVINKGKLIPFWKK